MFHSLAIMKVDKRVKSGILSSIIKTMKSSG